VVHNAVTVALTAEAVALQQVAGTLTRTDLDRSSPCPPWTIAELFCHLLIGADRIGPALAEPEDTSEPLISTAEYYRPDARFSAATNADRIEFARTLAARLRAEPATIAAELGRRCAESVALVAAAPAGRTVRTRHGDRMLLTDFAATRVVELAVHGLDLAIGLDREPWMTADAAAVLTGLLLPAGGADLLCRRLNCDQAGLIARLTGRTPLSPADEALLSSAGVVRLAFG
jgi:uncharacterized protein (TIGR03083 family)